MEIARELMMTGVECIIKDIVEGTQQTWSRSEICSELNVAFCSLLLDRVFDGRPRIIDAEGNVIPGC